ncbi:ABC transporter substrate-binding protein [Rhizobium sp. CFBP 8762]|uniref:ABC transporter substrate-binding protein n=1 Tax=Rhizobium sp. CFBP 8762 TaxID=2775279 RepID=UPI001FD4C46C|nr:ABC transporter substrate-binding protein [Rhizobium sp. CFBP 8762]
MKVYSTFKTKLRCLSFVCGLMTAFAPSAYADVIPALHDALPEAYRTNGVNVAVFNDWAPDEFMENGELKGWSVDLAKEISDRIGAEFKYTGTTFDALIPGLASKRFDAAFSSFGATMERMEIVDFIAQRREGSGYAYLKTKPLDIKEEKDLCGHSVAILNGSWDYQSLVKINEEKCVAAGLKPIDLQQFATQNAAELAVSSGRAEIVAAGSAKMGYFAKQIGTFEVSPLISNAVYSCIGVKRGDPLGAVIRDAIDAIIADGTYTKIMDKWGITAGRIDKSVLITKENPVLQ